MKKRVYVDVWSPSERKFKNFLEKIKKFIFYPLIILLIKLGFSANSTSYLSTILGITSAVYIFFNLRIAVIFLLLSLMFDGLDGTIARLTKTNKPKGSITDAFCDQITVTATTIGFVGVNILNPLLGIIYASAYNVLIIFTILRNKLKISNKYVLRPRLLIYSLFLVYFFTNINLLNPVVLFVSLIMIIYVIKDFLVLREKV